MALKQTEVVNDDFWSEVRGEEFRSLSDAAYCAGISGAGDLLRSQLPNSRVVDASGGQPSPEMPAPGIGVIEFRFDLGPMGLSLELIAYSLDVPSGAFGIACAYARHGSSTFFALNRSGWRCAPEQDYEDDLGPQDIGIDVVYDSKTPEKLGGPTTDHGYTVVAGRAVHHLGALSRGAGLVVPTGYDRRIDAVVPYLLDLDGRDLTIDQRGRTCSNRFPRWLAEAKVPPIVVGSNRATSKEIAERFLN
jgi:hypothetical protein